MHSTSLALGEIGPGAFLAITVGYIIGGILCKEQRWTRVS